MDPDSPAPSMEQIVVGAQPDHPGLKKRPPYWFPYATMAKGRWLGREILEVVSTEFRDRSMEYYRYALESGVTSINGKAASPDTIIKNGDRIENIVHRHEPPVTSTPVEIVLHDTERDFIAVNKPGSIPVHPCGRYFHNSLTEILKRDFGFKQVHTINRLDRLTSGLMVIPLNVKLAQTITQEFVAGSVKKEYVARVNGHFPDGDIVCSQPLITVDRQVGLNIVHPHGKHAVTVFTKMRYDPETDTSIVHCKPQTGRSHQIRVHLQYLGHPISNDSVYADPRIWGHHLAKGGIDLTPSDERSAPAPPEQAKAILSEHYENPEMLSSDVSSRKLEIADGRVQQRKLLPRETGDDIGMGSKVPLSAEAVEIITRLRNLKDENEDWSRWRDVIFRAKGALSPSGVITKKALPPQNRRERGTKGPSQEEEEAALADPHRDSNQLSADEASAKATIAQDPETGSLYCPECYLPLHPDPKPEDLYIFLHAWRYTMSLGTFETDLPEWAASNYKW
ncbi:pseudouridine synthase [Flagelloscypha sp. PMI_526]|nr:pseudouridine synthase [Flagelloscypha sp. PMI_526]